MLELNKWFFVLVVQFLVTLAILNVILFQPLLKIFKERSAAMEGSMEEAQRMAGERERMLGSMQKDFSAASQEARQRFEAKRSEGLQKQRATVEEAAHKAAKDIEQARKALSAESDRVRKALRGDVEKFADEIVRKLVSA